MTTKKPLNVWSHCLIKKNRNINFDIYGMDDVQPVWGSDFINAISKSNMGKHTYFTQ